jgi:hypothetical protein
VDDSNYSGPGPRREVLIPPALLSFAAQKRWVLWKWVKKGDKLTTPPFRADRPSYHASTLDASTWCDLQTAQLAYERRKCDGIGLVITNSELAAFDIDDCRDAATGTIHPWAYDKIKSCGSYAEVTPSREGVRIIGLATGDPLNRKFAVPSANGVSCELYRRATRFITVTGQQIGSASALINIDPLIDQTFTELGGVKEQRRTHDPDDDGRKDPDVVRETMLRVPTTKDHHLRVRVGMAIHHSTGSSDEGYAIWTEWLARGGAWSQREAKRQWSGFGRRPHPNPVGYGTLVRMADEANPGWRDESDREQIARMQRAYEAADEVADEDELYDQLGLADPEEQANGDPAIKEAAPGLWASEEADTASFTGPVTARPRLYACEAPDTASFTGVISGEARMPQYLKVLAEARAYVAPAEAGLRMWDFVYGRHLLRDTVSGTAAFGGTGKSSLAIAEALAMTTRRALVGILPPRHLRVGLINFEDTRNTIDKRIVAVMKHYKLKDKDIGDRLFIIAKGELPIKIATQNQRSGVVVRNENTISELVAFVRNNKLDVLSIDPFVATHDVNENDNQKIWAVVACYDNVAERARCAISLWHHTRKSGGGEATIESARGAVSFIDACRSVRILDTMTREEASKLKIEHPGLHFRSFSGKRNFAPPTYDSEWYRFENVDLNNGPIYSVGDKVGVVTSWVHPGAQELNLTTEKIVAIQTAVAGSQWREDVRAAMWVGKAVALALGLDAKDGRVKRVLNQLLQDGFLQVQPGRDEHRNERLFVVVGPGPEPDAI